MTIVQKSSVDRFSRLPTVVLTNILGELQSYKDLFNLIRASPEPLRIYVRYRQTVSNLRLNRFLELDLDGTMLQDALAIINFPRLDGASHLSAPVISDSVISDWSDALNARSFTYPQHTDSLYSFFTRLVGRYRGMASGVFESFRTAGHVNGKGEAD